MSQKEIIDRLKKLHELIGQGEESLRITRKVLLPLRKERQELTAALLGLAKKEDKK